MFVQICAEYHQSREERAGRAAFRGRDAIPRHERASRGRDAHQRLAQRFLLAESHSGVQRERLRESDRRQHGAVRTPNGVHSAYGGRPQERHTQNPRVLCGARLERESVGREGAAEALDTRQRPTHADAESESGRLFGLSSVA